MRLATAWAGPFHDTALTKVAWQPLASGRLRRGYACANEYVLTHNNPHLHLIKTSNGQIFLNACDFCKDLCTAAQKYFDKVETNPDLLEKAYKRNEIYGFLDLVKF